MNVAEEKKTKDDTSHSSTGLPCTARMTAAADDNGSSDDMMKKQEDAASPEQGVDLQEETKPKKDDFTSNMTLRETEECFDASQKTRIQEKAMDSKTKHKRLQVSSNSFPEIQLLPETQRRTKETRSTVADIKETKKSNKNRNVTIKRDGTNKKDQPAYSSSAVRLMKEISGLDPHSSTHHSSSFETTMNIVDQSHRSSRINEERHALDGNISSSNENQEHHTANAAPLPFTNHNHNLQGNGLGGRLVLPGAVSYSFRNGRREHRRPPLQWLPGGIMRKQQLTDGGPQPSTVYEMSDEFRSSSYRNRSSDDFSISERDAAEDPNNDIGDDNTEEQQQGRTQVFGDPYLISATLVEDDDTRQRAPPIPITPMVDDTHLLPLVDARTLPETSHGMGFRSQEDNGPPQDLEQPAVRKPKCFYAIQGRRLYLSVGAVVVVVVVVVLVTTLVGGGVSANESNMVMDEASSQTVPTALPSVLPSTSPSTSFLPSSAPSVAPSMKPTTSLAPSSTPSISAQPSASPTRIVSDMELMLRTNHPEVFETEEKQTFSEHDESSNWMKALRYVEETSTDMEDWRIAQRYALASIFYATNGVETPLVSKHHSISKTLGIIYLSWNGPKVAGPSGPIRFMNVVGLVSRAKRTKRINHHSTETMHRRQFPLCSRTDS